jgi:hypothetical protein
MYFIVSWEISVRGSRWSEIDEQMRKCLKNFQHFRPVNTYYMVRVPSADKYDEIHARLLAVAQRGPETVYFVMSPLLTATGYHGWLPQDRWPKIAKITV